MGLKQYTDNQITAAVEEMGSQAAAAIHLGVNTRTLERRLARIRSEEIESGESREIPEGHVVKGTSTLYDAQTGEPKLEWVKTSLDQQARLEAIQNAVDSLTTVDKPKPSKANPPGPSAETMAVIPITDTHIGMYAWGEEVGEDYDVNKAVNALCASVDYLVEQAAPSEKLVILQMGDFFHADNMSGYTERSHNILDIDGRMSRVLELGWHALERCIDKGLEHHESVEVVCVPGNHDEFIALATQNHFKSMYRNEPRCYVHPEPTTRKYLQYGNVMIGTVHGHQTKDNDLPGIMATEQPKMWGDTKHRYFFRGHHHHDRRIEYNGCIVEQVRTISAKDAYAYQHGYLSGRDMKAIVFDRDFGEVARSTVSIDYIKKFHNRGTI